MLITRLNQAATPPIRILGFTSPGFWTAKLSGPNDQTRVDPPYADEQIAPPSVTQRLSRTTIASC
jgi:hypothetical protein